MTKRKRPSRRRPAVDPPGKRHVYPRGWKADDWLVPFEDGEHACIHHGRTESSDHSLCGPSIFCCAKAARLYMERFPKTAEAHAGWQATGASHIATWMAAGVKVLYFVFCDPVHPEGLLAIGLSGDHARQVLHKRVPLDRYADEAERLG